MAETPRLSTGGPITSVDVASIIPESQASSLKSASQASAFLAQSSQALVERSNRLSQQAKEHFANIDTTAIELNRKAKAQDLILDATLKADEEIQSLLNTKGIEPLDLANRSEAILNRIANETVGQASGLGVEVRDFVRGKMNNLKIHHVPNVRKTGYRRETDERLAGLQRRNFHRKAELYKPETSQERQLELLAEIADDIKAHEGIHLSAQDTRKMLEGEEQEFLINTFYEMVKADPMAAQIMLNDPDVNLDPRQKMNMMQQAENILQAEENKERQRLADELKARNLRAEKLHSIITDDIILNNKDPREHFASPAVRDLLDGNQKQDLLSYYDARLAAKSKSKGNLGNFLLLKSQLVTEPLPPVKGVEAIATIQNNGGGFDADQMDDLVNANNTSWEKKQNLIRSELGKDVTTEEANIKRNFSFERGFISILEPNSQTELNFATTGALKTFNARVEFAVKQAEEQNLDPLLTVNVSRIADEVMIEYLPQVSKALRSQHLASGTFKSLAGPENLRRRKEEVAKDLAAKVEAGKMPEKEAFIIMNLWELNDRLGQLTQRERTKAGIEY